MDDKPEDRHDFRALYEERFQLEKEQRDITGEIELDDMLLAKQAGSPRQLQAWTDHKRYLQHRLHEIRARLQAIETAVTGKKPEAWKPSPEFVREITAKINALKKDE